MIHLRRPPACITGERLQGVSRQACAGPHAAPPTPAGRHEQEGPHAALLTHAGRWVSKQDPPHTHTPTLPHPKANCHCPLMPPHVPSCPLMPPHAPLAPPMPTHAPSWPLMPPHAPSRPLMPPHAPSCPLMALMPQSFQLLLTPPARSSPPSPAISLNPAAGTLLARTSHCPKSSCLHSPRSHLSLP